MKLILVLHNIRSCYNVGAIVRSAECFGVDKVVSSGYTPWPADKSALPHLAEKLERQVAKTALGAEKMVQCERSADIFKSIAAWRADGWEIVGLENNVSGTVALGDFRPSEKTVLVLGEEISGIDEALLAKMDRLIEIPLKGKKESLNVSVAAGVALWGVTGSDDV